MLLLHAPERAGSIQQSHRRPLQGKFKGLSTCGVVLAGLTAGPPAARGVAGGGVCTRARPREQRGAGEIHGGLQHSPHLGPQRGGMAGGLAGWDTVAEMRILLSC